MPNEARRPSKAFLQIAGGQSRVVALASLLCEHGLGEALGLTFQQVQKYEKGTNRIGASRLHQIAGILGVTIDFFYHGAPKVEASFAAVEEPSATDVSQFLSTSDGVELMKSFLAIKDAKVRRKVVELIAALSEEEGEPGKTPRSKRTGS
jgi:transcriptional regulator with XRE-family HTH domain